jgi:two-component system cell cycle response regulator
MDTSLKDFKIVVADDSPVYRKLVECTLAQEPCEIFFARNGKEGVALLAEHHPEVLLTDWEMPDISGLDLCARVRRDQHSYTYVILLTSNAEKDQLIRGLAAGADDYLTKPFHPGELLARVAVGRRVAQLTREIQAKNRLLEELALTDSLTGVPNRRAVEEWATRQLSGAARHGFPVWIAMADLDHFKTINDTYGHEAGDIVLKKIAEIIRTNTRSSNICGRIGGEEFIIVLAHVNKQSVHTAIEKIREQCENEKLTFAGRCVGVTASFGIAGFHGQKSPEFGQLLRDADAALYRAKRNGRNRIEFAS